MEIWSNKGRCKRLQAALLLDYFWLLTNKPLHTKRVSLCSIKKKIVVLMSLFMILSQVPRYIHNNICEQLNKNPLKIRGVDRHSTPSSKIQGVATP